MLLFRGLTIAVILSSAADASKIWPPFRWDARPNHHGGRKCLVSTTSGIIEGHPAPDRPEVTEFLGVRYAKAATGDLRFAPPEPPEPFVSNKYYNASQYSPDCPANVAPIIDYPPLTPHGSLILQEFLQQLNHTQSEDCLTLNVWTRSPRRLKRPKAVLLFFHRGRFQSPGSHNPFYNGKYLANAEDIVVVTFNKREAFLGYPGGTENLGLLDFRTVVEWVRDNIAQFGGDSKRITIWGQSSGGVAVDTYAFAYQENPIVHGLIADSGMAFNLTATYPGDQEQYFLNVSLAAGCPKAVDTALACLRKKPLKEILVATKDVKPTHHYQGVSLPPFRPTIENKTILANYTSLSRHGSFAKLPLLAGGVNHESGFYRITAFASNITMTDEEWREWEARTSYCPLLYQAHYRRQYGLPTWTYRYFGDWPNLKLYNGSGAYHGTELDIVFGTAEDVAGGVPNTLEEDETIRYMMKVWATFARDPHHGLEELGWRQFEVGEPSLARLGFNNQAKVSFADANEYAQYCPSLEDPMPYYGQPPFH